MKIAVVTMPVKNGQCEENVQYMIRKIEHAMNDKADLIIFPQNAISGYLLGDAWKDIEWCRYVDSFNDQILAYSDHIAIVWGNIKYRGGRLFNCAFYAYKGKTHMRVKKNQDHGLAFDSRYFDEQDMNSAIELGDHVLALNFKNELQLADLNLNIDAHPYEYESNWKLQGSYVYANPVGIAAVGKNVVVYQGGSRVVINSQLIYEAPLFQEDYALIDTTDTSINEPQQPALFDALICGIRAFDTETLGGKAPWIIGLSGGLDSSVNAALLTLALGKDRVLPFLLNSAYNRDITKANAKQEADALGITLRSGSIHQVTQASIDVVKEYGYDDTTWNSLVKENMQARIRGHLLSTFAQIHQGVISNNGNKVEVALGYCTLYGDAVGALGILGDVTKTQLFELAHDINERCHIEVIPHNLLPEIKNGDIHWEMPPSAELKDDQLDPMKWFYHDYLVEHLSYDLTVEKLMKMYLDGSVWKSEIADWMKYYDLQNPQKFCDDLDWFTTTMKRNGFKRLQTPPIISISANTFGSSRIETLTTLDLTRYKELKTQILDMKK